jgi:ABC-type uncharacterized transport system auxiliary subunit
VNDALKQVFESDTQTFDNVGLTKRMQIKGKALPSTIEVRTLMRDANLSGLIMIDVRLNGDDTSVENAHQRFNVTVKVHFRNNTVLEL